MTRLVLFVINLATRRDLFTMYQLLNWRTKMCPFAARSEAIGDLVALEECYHSGCVVGLYKRANSVEAAKEKPEHDIVKPDGIALAELISFIEEARTSSSESIPVFKLSDLVSKEPVCCVGGKVKH